MNERPKFVNMQRIQRESEYAYNIYIDVRRRLGYEELQKNMLRAELEKEKEKYAKLQKEWYATNQHLRKLQTKAQERKIKYRKLKEQLRSHDNISTLTTDDGTTPL